MRRLIRWWVLLTKRLLRRGGYVAVLLAVPVLALLLTLGLREESGLVTVALWRENPEDAVSAAAVQRLLENPGTLSCYEAASKEAALAAVESGEADAAWIFRPDADAVIADFDALGPPAVTVVERRDNVLLMLARERLNAALYPELSFSVFSRFLRDIDPATEFTPALLLRYYRVRAVDTPLVSISYADGGESQAAGYLSSPLRGMLALLMLLAGLASALYAYREREQECFVWLSPWKRRALPLLCHLTALLPVALAVLLALAAARLWGGADREVCAMALYVPACACFCELLRRLCRRESVLAPLVPVLLLVSLLVCPVFLELPRLRPLQLLLPTFYYLKAVGNPAWLLRELGYTVALAVLTGVSFRMDE